MSCRFEISMDINRGAIKSPKILYNNAISDKLINIIDSKSIYGVTAQTN